VLVSAPAGTLAGNRDAQAGAACQEAASTIITFSLIERQAETSMQENQAGGVVNPV
jgi:hypothetical protein